MQENLENIDVRVERVVNYLSGLESVNKIVLYGSRARGTELEWSDIDLAIELDEDKPTDWLKIEEMMHINPQTLLDVDIVDLGRHKNSELGDNISREGKVVYERN